MSYQLIPEVVSVHPLGFMNNCAKRHSNPFSGFGGTLVKTINVNRSAGREVRSIFGPDSLPGDHGCLSKIISCFSFVIQEQNAGLSSAAIPAAPQLG